MGIELRSKKTKTFKNNIRTVVLRIDAGPSVFRPQGAAPEQTNEGKEKAETLDARQNHSGMTALGYY